MIYYKIVKNGIIIDANFNFIKWNNEHQCMLLCDINEAEFVQSSDLTKFYHDGWLRSCSNKNIQYEEVSIIIINNVEYDEIITLLNENEEIIIPPLEEQLPNESSQNELKILEEEKPMTISQMREKIILQLLQINMLTDCLLEMSEIIYA